MYTTKLVILKYYTELNVCILFIEYLLMETIFILTQKQKHK